MAVKIRLMRIGAKKRPFYRVVAIDERKQRSGKYLEALGTYNPLTEPKEIILKQDKINEWLKRGAILSDGYLRITKQAPQKPPRKPKKPARNASQSDAGGEKEAKEPVVETLKAQETDSQKEPVETPVESNEPQEAGVNPEASVNEEKAEEVKEPAPSEEEENKEQE